MTKSELIKKISNKYSNHSIETITEIINNIFNDLTTALINKDKAEIRRFGSFSVRKRKMKVLNNSQIIEKDHNIIYFRAGKDFKHFINSFKTI